MSTINIDNRIKDDASQKVHFMPCKISQNGPANVQKYFEPYIARDDNNDMTASFRGYPLNGAQVSVPEGYVGVNVIENRQPLTEESDRQFRVDGTFKDFVLWNWDAKTTKNDGIIKAFDWIDIAEALHSS